MARQYKKKFKRRYPKKKTNKASEARKKEAAIIRNMLANKVKEFGV